MFNEWRSKEREIAELPKDGDYSLVVGQCPLMSLLH
jgi:hypothetical protein